MSLMMVLEMIDIIGGVGDATGGGVKDVTGGAGDAIDNNVEYACY